MPVGLCTAGVQHFPVLARRRARSPRFAQGITTKPQPLHAPGCCVRLLPAGMSSRRRSAGGGSSRSGRSARRARQQRRQQQMARCVARLSSHCLPNKSPRWAAATACTQFLRVQHSRTLPTMTVTALLPCCVYGLLPAQANGDAGGSESEPAAAAAEGEDKPKPEEGEEEPEPVDEAAQEQVTDDLALTIIMGIVSNRKLPPPPPTDELTDKREERRSSHRGTHWPCLHSCHAMVVYSCTPACLPACQRVQERSSERASHRRHLSVTSCTVV